MNKIIFKKIRNHENKFDKTDITIEVEATTLDELINVYKDFLLACGYFVNKDACLECGELKCGE